LAVAALDPRLRAGGPRGDLVRETLDLGAIMAVCPEDRGQPPYHPAMATGLLPYIYREGIYASRRIARACEEQSMSWR
jgi:transposase